MIWKVLEVPGWDSHSSGRSGSLPRVARPSSAGAAQRYELFEQLCGLKPEDRIIDVGAGWGAALERFNTVNPIVAVDLEPRHDASGSARRT